MEYLCIEYLSWESFDVCVIDKFTMHLKINPRKYVEENQDPFPSTQQLVTSVN